MPEEETKTFETVDWSKKDEVLTLFPTYIQEKIKNERAKTVSNTVDIEPFTLQTPFKDKTLLKNTKLFLEPNKRMAMFGRNGTGKTLLFERCVDGSIKGWPKHLCVHHCKEMDHVDESVAESVFDTILHSHEHMMFCRKALKKVDELIAAGSSEGLEEVKTLIELQLRSLQSDTAEDRITKMCRALGFDEDGMARSINDLSGGLRMRVALAVAFFADADLLLLDEPTNHLDFPSVLWLENRLRGYGKSFLMVTHDRDLLNNVCTGVMLLEDSKIHYYNCGFKEFERRKEKDDKKKSDDIEKFLKMNRNIDPSTSLGAQVVAKRRWVDDYQEKLVQMQGKFTFPKASLLAGQKEGEEVSLLRLDNVTFSYKPESGNFIFENPISFDVKTNSRVGIMGPNGAGKSTLLKLLTSKLTPTTGESYTHPDFVLAYFGQHSTKELDMEKTPMEFMMEQFPDAKSGILRNHLAKTSIRGGVESTRMRSLSYSQRSCVIFSKLTFVCPHLLIMDEPTNFLDIESVDSLIAAANKFPGALLVVTHSRHFLRKCAKQYLSVVPGQFLMFDGMKEAEEATYTFIQEVESGGKIDTSALAAGGGSLHSGAGAKKRDVGGAAGKADGPLEAPDAKFAVGEEVSALWTDKKWYEGKVVKIASVKPLKYSVHYPKFNKVANLPEAGLKKVEQKAALAAKAKETAANAAAARKKAGADALAAAKAHKWQVGEKCMAMGSDGRFYAAEMVRVNGFDMFVVKFEGKAENTTIPLKKLRIFDPAAVASAGGAPRGGAKGGAKGPAGAKGGRGGARGGQRGGRQQQGQRGGPPKRVGA